MEVDAQGKMTIHGVSNEIQVRVNISEKEGFTVVKCKIPVVFKDFNVTDPSILSKSVEKDVLIKVVVYLN